MRVLLTPRQRQVLELASEGLTARQIAAELGIAEPTARTHKQDVIRALGAHNMTEACVKYEREVRRHKPTL